METFLQKAAKHIFDSRKLNELSKISVILPSRRAVFFFKHELSQLSEIPFLAPEVLAIDDFVFQTNSLKQIEPVALLFELYDIFKEINPQIDFDKFVTWAPTLLQDFDKIDQYLSEADAKALFQWVSDAKAIERWDITQTQIAGSSVMDKYFKLFENLGLVYLNLKHKLLSKGLVYRGLAYKILSENTYKFLIEKPKFDFYYFVGFNALSDSEEKIFRDLIKAKRAEVLWDTDDLYMNSPKMEAGNLLRIYKGAKNQEHRKIGGKDWNWQQNLLTKSPKNIKIIGLTNASMQTKVASNIYESWLQDDKKNKNLPQQTAIVLGDEALLQPLLFSLNDNIDDLNVTMGQSLKNAQFFSLIDALFELQRNVVEFKNKDNQLVSIPKYAHKHISKVLNHPLIRSYEMAIEESKNIDEESELKPSIIKKVLLEISKKNLVFLSENELITLAEDNQIFKILFSRWNQNASKAIKCFYDLIEILRPILAKKNDIIETEYLFVFFTIIKRLEDILASRKDKVPFKSFRVFLYEFIKKEKIPFSGEPISKLQIMGMLETRTLDFERLIVMSVNEGVLPQGKKANSLIPIDACIEFGLPTHGEMDAVMAYHFFRLLQRANEIVLLHVLPSNTYGGAEKSRFLLQIEHELVKINPKITLTYPMVSFGENHNHFEISDEISIPKTNEIIDFLQGTLAEKGFNATFINDYVQCSLKFYFKRIAQISSKDEVNEQIGSDKFGNWIHKTLEEIDLEFIKNQGGKIEKKDLEKLLPEIENRLKTTFKKSYDGLRFDEGMNLVLFEVARRLLNNYFQFRIENTNFPVYTLSVEQAFEDDYIFNNQHFKINGRIDKVEAENENLNIIDYKTGTVMANKLATKSKSLSVEEIFMADSKSDKLRQLWIYKYLVLKSKKELISKNLSQEINIEKLNVQPGFVAFKNVEAGFMTVNWENFELFSDQEFLSKTDELLNQFLKNLLDVEQPFSKTADKTNCEYCDYRKICNR